MFDRRSVRGLLIPCLATALAGCSSPGLVSIQISPTAETFVGGQGTAQFTAIGTFQKGDHPPTKRDITDQVTWKSNAVSVATINSSGVTTSEGLGTTVISANMDGFTGLVTGYASVTVCEPNPSNPTQCAE